MGQLPNTQRVKVFYNTTRGQYRDKWVVMKQSFPALDGQNPGSYQVKYYSDTKSESVKKARKLAKKTDDDVEGVLRIYKKSGELSEETRYD